MVGVALKKKVINKLMNTIEKNKKYNEIELKEIEYGLVSIYLTITKIIFILILSIVLGIFKEALIFMLFFNVIRTFAFGLHATKSWICWITSTFTFIVIPLISKYLVINTFVAEIICLINVLLIFKNSPADTKKRPIVNRKRRIIYNGVSTVIAIIYSILAIIINNNYITNCLIWALVVENILISPTTYKLFKMSYNNYIDFLKSHPDFTY